MEAPATPARSLVVSEYDDRLTRVGIQKDHYEWSTHTNDDFIEWWHRTKWYIAESRKPAKSQKIPTWGKQRHSAGWEYFNEAAERISGEPKLICQRCDHPIKHPKKNGTTGLSSHPLSIGCRAIAMQRGLGQPTIQEGFKAGVRPENLPEICTS